MTETVVCSACRHVLVLADGGFVTHGLCADCFCFALWQTGLSMSDIQIVSQPAPFENTLARAVTIQYDGETVEGWTVLSMTDQDRVLLARAAEDIALDDACRGFWRSPDLPAVNTYSDRLVYLEVEHALPWDGELEFVDDEDRLFFVRAWRHHLAAAPRNLR